MTLDPLTHALTVISQDDEEGLSFDSILEALYACSILATHGFLWRCEYYTRTRRAYLEVAYSRSHKRGQGNVFYRRHWAWLPSKPGTTMSLCTQPESASKAVSGGAGDPGSPAEGVGDAGLFGDEEA